MTRRAVRNPAWLGETVRTKLRALPDRNRRFVLADHADLQCSVDEALADAFGVSQPEYRAAAARVRIPPAPDGSIWGGGLDILYLLGSLVRLRRPAVAIETGVAMGFTTAVILSAMDENELGVLHSIDLPPLQVDPAAFVGEVVPAGVRARWTLHVGPSRRLLGGVTQRLSPIDLFVHDSDHSYAAQHEEYAQAWKHMASGACLVSDDVCNPAFIEFAGRVGERPYLIAPPGHQAAVGLLVKSR